MKISILVLMTTLTLVGCGRGSNLPEVTFEWFNLGTNQIWVTDVIGLPAEASPGRLMPSRAEDQLETSSSVFQKSCVSKIKLRLNGGTMEKAAGQAALTLRVALHRVLHMKQSLRGMF